MKKSFWSLLFVATVLLSLRAFAQTNGAVPPPVILDPITVTSFSTALLALLHYAGLSPANIGYIGIALHFGAKWLIDYPMKNTTGKLASIVSHIAIEGALEKESPAKALGAFLSSASASPVDLTV